MANPTISQIAINGTTYDACDSQARADIKTLQDSVLYRSGGSMTGTISMNGNSIYWRENGYGDKFAIVPSFSGADDANLLKIQSAVGAANTDPTLSDKVTISGKSGNVSITGDLQVNGKLKGYTWDLSTNNTTDTWTPVLNGTTIQHRVIPKNIDTAITGISRSGTTFTATRADGTTFTFTQQDSYPAYSTTSFSASSNTKIADSSVNYIGKFGRVVFFSVIAQTTANVAAYASIFTLPSGYRPAAKIYLDGVVGGTGANCRLILYTNGNISTVEAFNSGTSLYLSGCFLSS